MNYKEVLEKIHSSQTLGSRLGLERMRALMDALGNPEDDMKIIHVGGTNGKGSVCGYLTEVLKENGYELGTFISPYLKSPLDSILLDGVDISKEDFAVAASKVFEAADSLNVQVFGGFTYEPTEFELLTAIALVYFADKAVDFVVLEVGLGGGEDATNIIKTPLVSVITSVSIDHKGVLGDGVEEIARKKAGIIKPAFPVVSNVRKRDAKKIITKRAQELASEFYDATLIKPKAIEKNLTGYAFTLDKSHLEALMEALSAETLRVKLGMVGEHQVSNSICALSVVNLLVKQGIISVSKEKLLRAMANAFQKGRLEIIQRKPLIIADGAHNLEGIRALKKVVEDHFRGRKILFVIGMIKGKEVDLILKEICSLKGHIRTTEPKSPLRLKAEELCLAVEKAGCPCESLGSMEKAFEYINEVKDSYDAVIITGSLYLAGRVREFFENGNG